jgi:hypothetical protein
MFDHGGERLRRLFTHAVPVTLLVFLVPVIAL